MNRMVDAVSWTIQGGQVQQPAQLSFDRKHPRTVIIRMVHAAANHHAGCQLAN